MASSTPNDLVIASSGNGLRQVSIRPSAKTSSGSPANHQLEPQGHFLIRFSMNLKDLMLRFQVSCVTLRCVYILSMNSWRSIGTWGALLLVMPWSPCTIRQRLREQTWLCVYCWCQTPEGVVSPHRAITRAQPEWSPRGDTTPEGVWHQQYTHNHVWSQL